VEVREYGDKVIFLRKITEGTADHSYGIQVAQMAGLPEEVTRRAKEILKSFEDKKYRKTHKDDIQISLFEVTTDETPLKNKLKEIDINTISPIEALNILKSLKDGL
jgi:DNA mismatch repair protein MutS